MLHVGEARGLLPAQLAPAAVLGVHGFVLARLARPKTRWLTARRERVRIEEGWVIGFLKAYLHVWPSSAHIFYGPRSSSHSTAPLSRSSSASRTRTVFASRQLP